MKLEHLVGDRFKERPADCQVDSHALMVRGGYIKYVANGIYSSYPLKAGAEETGANHAGRDGRPGRSGSAVPGGDARLSVGRVRPV